MEEADGAQTKPDFKTKAATARKEAKESVYWLRLIAATEPSLRGAVSPLLAEADQIASIVTTIGRNASSGSRGATITGLFLAAILYGILSLYYPQQ
jgi:four helix bundle protein